MSDKQNRDSESSDSSSDSSSSSPSSSSSSSSSESSPRRQQPPSPKRRRNEDDNKKIIPTQDDQTGDGTQEANKAASQEENEMKPPSSEVKPAKPSSDVYLKLLPFSTAYERSYMHRDSLTHVLMTPKTNFLITASIDGVLKFWKKKSIGIEFVIKFRAHLSAINDMTINPIGTLLATISDDYNLKMFDVINFDMINMIKLDFKPGCLEWCYSKTSKAEIAVSDKESNKIYIFDEMCQQAANPLMVLEKHPVPVVRMRFNAPHNVMVSIDGSGVLNYWSPYTEDCRFPASIVRFKSQMDTDLYEMAKAKTYPHDIAFSPDGNTFAAICNDRKIRVFSFRSGKLVRTLNETLQAMTELQQNEQQLPNMEFGRRIAIERDLEKSDMFHMERIVFDCGGNYLVYPNMFGIKIINWRTGNLAKMIGKEENFRPLAISLCQEKEESKYGAVVTPEMLASENPNIIRDHEVDATLFCTGFRKNRFYLFTKREPDDSSMTVESEGVLTGLERDVFNEKPSQEDMIAATATDSLALRKKSVAAESAIMHTSLGDIHVKLFAKQCPKTIENFVTHSRNGYYNGHIFHRVIRRFMIQTGDPTGTGTAGESIWGGEFEDELCDDLKHDKPFTLSMANAGPNTNGSQFFITVIPTPWLDGKHTVFGRVTKGMDIVQNISQVRTHPKTDKPYDDIKIVNIQIK